MRYVVVQTILLVLLGVVWFGEHGPRLLIIGQVPEATVSWVHGAGIGLCLLSVLLVAFSYRSIRSVFQAAPAPREDGELITVGVYGTFRHPMYTAAVLGSCGLFLARPTLLVACGAFLVIVFYLIKARHEEGLLRRRYPDYEEYVSRTHGVMPTFRGR